MGLILSIQSHVAYGYVGNRAATFPLQVMGHEVIQINTVQFSNHTGYGAWTGEIFSKDHIQDLLKGIRDRGLFPQISAVLSGYLGASALGDVILDTVAELKSQNKDLLYCCDPVMGDVGRGFFVSEGIPPFFRDHALQKADIITPNLFELETLSGEAIKTLEDARRACQKLYEDGPKMILVTSVQTAQTPTGMIEMLLSIKDGQAFLIQTPELVMDIAPNGSGDMTAAVFLGFIQQGNTPQEALGHTAAAIFKVFEQTQKDQRRELALVKAQDAFREKDTRFAITKL
jgi:pyridoxine kinase